MKSLPSPIHYSFLFACLPSSLSPPSLPFPPSKPISACQRPCSLHLNPSINVSMRLAAARLTVRPGVERRVPAQLRAARGPGNKQEKSPDYEEQRELLFSSWPPTTLLSHTYDSPLPLPSFLLLCSLLPPSFSTAPRSYVHELQSVIVQLLYHPQ